MMEAVKIILSWLCGCVCASVVGVGLAAWWFKDVYK